MRSFLIILVTTIWTMAMMAPAVCTLLDGSGRTFLVMNITEEEQQGQQGKQDLNEKQIMDLDASQLLISIYRDKSVSPDFYSAGQFAHILEIILPPPEFRA